MKKIKPEYFLVLVASLGYFVDIYDLILFNVVKKSSLIELGYGGAELANTGIYLFNMQMTGMLHNPWHIRRYYFRRKRREAQLSE